VLLEAAHVVYRQCSALNVGCVVDMFLWVRLSVCSIRSIEIRALGRKTLREVLKLKWRKNSAE